jgi:hypothetical protein
MDCRDHLLGPDTKEPLGSRITRFEGMPLRSVAMIASAEIRESWLATIERRWNFAFGKRGAVNANP